MYRISNCKTVKIKMPNGHKMNPNFPFQGIEKCTKIENYDMQIYIPPVNTGKAYVEAIR
jgi:hypothetical protein